MRAFNLSLPFLLACSLAQAEALTVIVVQQDGKPAPGAKICVATLFHSPPLRTNVTADEQGAFRIDLAKGSTYSLAVRWQTQGADLTEALNSNGKAVRISGQKLPSQTVRLGPAGTLRGKLLRAEDGGLIAAARLFLDTGEVLTTDAHGAFTVSGLPMKDHSLIPVAQGRVRSYVLFDTTLRTDAELELRLPRGAIIKGRVTDEDGKPIPGAFLKRASSGATFTLNGWDEVCAPDGSFEYGGLSSQRLFYSLQAEAPGYRGQEIKTEVDNPMAVVELTVRLHKDAAAPKPASMDRAKVNAPATRAAGSQTSTTKLPRRTISGFVRDGDGDRIPGATVRWAAFLWDLSVRSTTTDAAGKYRLPGVPAGTGALLIIADSYAPQFVPVDREQENLDVRLAHGTTVRGTVRGSSGKPVAGVHIVPVTHCLETGVCNPIWLDERATQTNEKGEFSIAAISVKGVSFDFLKDGYSERRNVVLSPDEARNEIDLIAGGAISGNVVDARGEPVRNFKIRVMIPRAYKPNELAGGYYAGYDWYGITYTNRDGFFILTGLGANSLARLIVTSPGIGLAIVDRVKSEPLDRVSQEENRTIPLKPYAPLTVRILDSSSRKPISKGMVALLEDEINFSNGLSWGYHDLWAERRHTDADGKAQFAEPACDDGTIIVRVPGFARQRVPWANGKREMTVSLEPAAAIRGDVRLRGQLLAEGYARLTSSAKDNFGIDLSETQGRFDFDQLPAGDYQFVISNGREEVLHKRPVKLVCGRTQTENVAVSESRAVN